MDCGTSLTRDLTYDLCSGSTVLTIGQPGESAYIFFLIMVFSRYHAQGLCF